MMSIESLSALLQLAATLSIALVAVEYAEKFAEVIIDNILKIGRYICDKFDICVAHLNTVNIDNITPVTVGDLSSVQRIERAKRQNEKIRKTIENERERCSKEKITKFQSRSLSSLSLWLFMYCVFALLFSGLEYLYPETIHHMWIILSSFTLVYMIIGWSIGERKQYKWLNFLDISQSFLYFVFALFLSFAIALVNNMYFQLSFGDDVWNVVYPTTSMLPFVNFLLYISIAKSKYKKFKKEINEKYNEIIKDCREHVVEVEKLLQVHNLIAEMRAETVLSSEIKQE